MAVSVVCVFKIHMHMLITKYVPVAVSSIRAQWLITIILFTVRTTGLGETVGILTEMLWVFSAYDVKWDWGEGGRYHYVWMMEPIALHYTCTTAVVTITYSAPQGSTYMYTCTCINVPVTTTTVWTQWQCLLITCFLRGYMFGHITSHTCCSRHGSTIFTSFWELYLFPDQGCNMIIFTSFWEPYFFLLLRAGQWCCMSTYFGNLAIGHENTNIILNSVIIDYTTHSCHQNCTTQLK